MSVAFDCCLVCRLFSVLLVSVNSSSCCAAWRQQCSHQSAHGNTIPAARGFSSGEQQIKGLTFICALSLFSLTGTMVQQDCSALFPCLQNFAFVLIAMMLENNQFNCHLNISAQHQFICCILCDMELDLFREFSELLNRHAILFVDALSQQLCVLQSTRFDLSACSQLVTVVWINASS